MCVAMIRILLAVVLICSTSSCSTSDVRFSSDLKTGNWRALFAADLSDAVFPKGVWQMADGILTATEDKCIWTKDPYENFVLDLEFRMADAANSGVIVYCSDRENWIPNSVEIQILDDHSPKWSKVPDTWRCGGLFGHSVPMKRAVRKAGRWNRMTILCRGQHIRVWLNGLLVTDADLKNWTSAKKNPDGSEIPPWLSKPLAELPTKGYIGLQGKHGDAAIHFRNIRIRALE